MRATLRPEERVLLCCARAQLDELQVAELRILVEQGLDWKELGAMAWLHGLIPLLYWHLRAHCAEKVPPESLAYLQRWFEDTETRSLNLTRELLVLLDLLKAQGIVAVPLKGPLVGASIYGNLALRRFYDLDILVHPQDVPRAREVLATRGYQLRVPLTPAQEKERLNSPFVCEYSLVREGGPQANGERTSFVVDLHWGVTAAPFPRITLCDLQDRLVAVPLLEAEVPGLAPEDLLLILCVHGSKHFWTRTEWIGGVAGLLRAHPEWDWPQLVVQAHAWKVQRFVALGLLVARECLGALVPEEALTRLQATPRVRALSQWVAARLFLSHNRAASVIDEISLHHLIESRPNQMRFIGYYLKRRLTPNSRDRQFVSLPPLLTPLYYLLRPARLVSEYGMALLKALGDWKRFGRAR